MTKQTIFLDFDETITASADSFCRTYNEIFKNHPQFKPAYAEEVDSYDFTNICPLLYGNRNLIDTIFGHEMFFEFLTPFPNAIEVLEKQVNNYDIILCSIGNSRNIELKTKWVSENLPFIKKRIFLEFDDYKTNRLNKGIVRMDGAMMIDDNLEQLNASNAKRKITFGNNAWNKEWNGERVTNWLELDELLINNSITH